MSTATELLKARKQYIELATSRRNDPNVSGRNQNLHRARIRLQAFNRLSNAYEEYVSKHGVPEEED